MPLVPAICTQCGSKLEVDPNKEAAVCPYCHTPFITEKAINNYNTTNITNIGNLHANVVNVSDSQSIDNRVKSGETFIQLNDYASAEKIFSELTEACPYDYRGWWGLIRVYSTDFSDIAIDRKKLLSIERLYQKAIVVASIDEQKTIEPQWKAYYIPVKEKLDMLLLDTQTKIEKLETEFNHYKRDKEEQINDYSKQKENIKNPSDKLAIAVLVIIGFQVVVTIVKDGFWLGILALFIYGVIGSGILYIVADLMDRPSKRKREEIDAKIRKLNSELASYTNKYNLEMKLLNEIIQKVR